MGFCINVDAKCAYMRPSTVSKETWYSVKRDLVHCQKRPSSKQGAYMIDFYANTFINNGLYINVDKCDINVDKCKRPLSVCLSLSRKRERETERERERERGEGRKRGIEREEKKGGGERERERARERERERENMISCIF